MKYDNFEAMSVIALLAAAFGGAVFGMMLTMIAMATTCSVY